MFNVIINNLNLKSLQDRLMSHYSVSHLKSSDILTKRLKVCYTFHLKLQIYTGKKILNCS